MNDLVVLPTKIYINGIEFSVNFFVVLETCTTTQDKSLLFGCIQEIIHTENKEGRTYLLTSVYTSVFDPYMNAYRMQISNPIENRFVKISSLPYYKSMCSWKKRTSDDMYISLRHVVL